MPPDPTFLGVDIHERLWPLAIQGDTDDNQRALVTINGKNEEGQLFVRPEDGAVVFRQITKDTLKGESNNE
jgi:hypothetical protein